MTTFQQLHQTAPEAKGRGDCYYANLKESSLTWTIMLVLSRIELTPSTIKAPNLPWRISILLFFFQQIFYWSPSSTIKKKKLNQTFSPVWVTFHAALKVVVCLLNWNDYRFVLYCIVFIYTLTMALNASKRGFIAKEGSFIHGQDENCDAQYRL